MAGFDRGPPNKRRRPDQMPHQGFQDPTVYNNRPRGDFGGGKRHADDYWSVKPGAMNNDLPTRGPVLGMNRVLLFTVHNPKYPITVDVLSTICSSHGKLLRVQIMKKTGVQALIEFETAEAAQMAKDALNGADIYSGCCTLQIEHTKMAKLTVYKNDQDSWDFTGTTFGKDKRPLLGSGPDGNPSGYQAEGESYMSEEQRPSRTHEFMEPPVQGGYEQFPRERDGYGRHMGPRDGFSGAEPSSYSGDDFSHGRMGMEHGGRRPSRGGERMMRGGDRGPHDRMMHGERLPPPHGEPYGRIDRGEPPSRFRGHPDERAYHGDRGPPGRGPMERGPLVDMRHDREGRPGDMRGGRDPKFFGEDFGPGVGPPFDDYDPGANAGFERDGTPAIGGAGYNSVVMVYGLCNAAWNCSKLFNLFCLYGNIVKVKFLRSKESVAMVQMADHFAVQRLVDHFEGTNCFDDKITFSFSTQVFIQDPSAPHKLKDGSPSFVTYVNSRMNRYNTPVQAAKNWIQPPSATLHFFNCPVDADSEQLTKIFLDAGAKRPSRVKLVPGKDKAPSATGLAQFASPEEATEAICWANNVSIPNPKGRFPFLFKLCYTTKVIGKDRL